MKKDSIKFSFCSSDPVIIVSLSFELPFETSLFVSDYPPALDRAPSIEDVEITGIRAVLQAVAVEKLNECVDRLHREISAFHTEIVTRECAELRESFLSRPV